MGLPFNRFVTEKPGGGAPAPSGPKPVVPPTGNPYVDIATFLITSGAAKKAIKKIGRAFGFGKSSNPKNIYSKRYGVIPNPNYKPPKSTAPAPTPTPTPTPTPMAPSPDISTPGYGVPGWGTSRRVSIKPKKKSLARRLLRRYGNWWYGLSPQTQDALLGVAEYASTPGVPVLRRPNSGRPPLSQSSGRSPPRPLSKMRGSVGVATRPTSRRVVRPRRTQEATSPWPTRAGARRRPAGRSLGRAGSAPISASARSPASLLVDPLRISVPSAAPETAPVQSPQAVPYVKPSSTPVGRPSASSSARRSATAAPALYFRPLGLALAAAAAKVRPALAVSRAAPARATAARVGSAGFGRIQLGDFGSIALPPALAGLGPGQVGRIGFAEGVRPQVWPVEALARDRCDCPPKKKRKPKKNRTECWSGTFKQTARGVSYQRTKKIACVGARSADILPFPTSR